MTRVEYPLERVAEQFDSLEQQRLSAMLGMWAFLATEVLFFGVLFTAYTIYRVSYPDAFAQASSHLYETIGAINTAVLLISSYFVAMAVHGVEHKSPRAVASWLAGAAGLGCVFLVLKGIEYKLDIHEGLVPGAGFAAERFHDPRHAELFMLLYWIMTGLHALHVTIGIVLLSIMVVRITRSRRVEDKRNWIENIGLYWHFVDVVWIFLLPLLYLIG